jgi:hypothetical protein
MAAPALDLGHSCNVGLVRHRLYGPLDEQASMRERVEVVAQRPVRVVNDHPRTASLQLLGVAHRLEVADLTGVPPRVDRVKDREAEASRF